MLQKQLIVVVVIRTSWSGKKSIDFATGSWKHHPHYSLMMKILYDRSYFYFVLRQIMMNLKKKKNNRHHHPHDRLKFLQKDHFHSAYFCLLFSNYFSWSPSSSFWFSFA